MPEKYETTQIAKIFHTYFCISDAHLENFLLQYNIKFCLPNIIYYTKHTHNMCVCVYNVCH